MFFKAQYEHHTAADVIYNITVHYSKVNISLNVAKLLVFWDTNMPKVRLKKIWNIKLDIIDYIHIEIYWSHLGFIL